MRPTPLLCLLLGCSTAPSAPGPGLAGARTAPPLDLGGRQLKLTAPSPGSEDEFGFAVAGAGDVDGDGFDDVLVGAHQDDDTAANAGAAFLFMGAEDGLDSGRTFTLLADDGAGADELGLAVAGLGDLDGDGFADLGIGAPRHDAGGAQAGAVYLWLGSEDGPVAGDKLVLGSAGSESGAAVAGLGDVDGDGLPDFAVGGPSQDGSGAVWVLGGGDLSTLATLVAADREDSASYGAALDGGDLDGDGYDDVVVGAY